MGDWNCMSGIRVSRPRREFMPRFATLSGLSVRPELNHLRVSLLDYDASCERWAVEIPVHWEDKAPSATGAVYRTSVYCNRRSSQHIKPYRKSGSDRTAYTDCGNYCVLELTPFPDRGIPQSSLSAVPRVGRPARASGSLADCATWWSWSPRPDEPTVGTSAVLRVVQRMTGSCQPIHVSCRQSWITAHISITASPARARTLGREFPKV